MKKALFALVAIIVVAGIGLSVYFHSKSKNTIYNTFYVNGNSAGNLYNAGLFCENNGCVFFANPDDHNALYSMNSDGSNLQKLSNDSATYINADNNYIYYIKNTQTSSSEYAIDALYSYSQNCLCRIDRDGKNKLVLDDDPCLYATLIGNYIYYLHYDKEQATTLYKIGIDGKQRSQVSKEQCFTCSASDQYFFYNGMTTDGSIYQFDTTTDTSTKVYSCNSYKPIVSSDGNAYYLDVNQNNALVHTDLNYSNPIYLTKDSIDHYNVYGSYIYYQKYSKKGNAFCKIKNDGSDYHELLSGDYCSINITSYYIYVKDFRTGQIFYTSTSNPGDFEIFHPGIIK